MYESTLNTWLAELLARQGLDARPESKQAGGKRLDIQVDFDDLKIALEAEQGASKQKRAEAIKDADSRLRDELVDCAIAICYPDGIQSASQLAQSELLHTLRAPGDRSHAAKAKWERSGIAQLASVIRQIPAQLGEPDKIAARLSFSLDRAVARLSESQKRDLAASLDLPAGKAQRIELGSAQTSRYNQAAKRALLVIATAVMFHARLDTVRDDIPARLDNRQDPPTPYTGAWPPQRASICAASDDPIDAFYQAWGLWLVVDYKPIFATARNALHGCAHDHSYSEAARGVAKAALQVLRNIVGLRHDLLGRIFHKVLETARYDGSFYTTTAAATLLANLAIREDGCDWDDPDAIAQLRISDPACGTGTLLMAAAERIRDLSGGADREQIAKTLIEDVLTGYDVNLTATHLAATTLGLLSPTTTFNKMKIFRALLGVEKGAAYLGSLELLSRENQPRLLGWPTGVAQIESQREASEAEPADLVIMNPPFTRDSLRHDQFDREQEALLKAREKELFAGQPVHRSGGSNAFLVLADHINKNKSSTLASVLPLTLATDASGMPIRQFLAKKYHIDTIVTSHDPTRIYFSENTNIGEMLLICRRHGSTPPRINEKLTNSEFSSGDSLPSPNFPTKIVNLYENPSTPAESLLVARHIAEGNTESIRGSLQFWPRERIEKGDWGGVQFLSPFLCQAFNRLCSGKYFAIRPLNQVAIVGPSGKDTTTKLYRRTDMPDELGRTALWFHKTDITQKMLAQTDTYIKPMRNKERQAVKLWESRGRLMIAIRIFLPTIRCLSVRLNEKTIGASWALCRPTVASPDKINEETLEKFLCAYFNSSIGILAMLGDRTNKKPTYPRLSVSNLRRIPVPDFAALGEARVGRLAAAYDALCEFTLLPLPQILRDETRLALDRIVTDALGIDAEVTASVRRELSREPSITGKRYAV